MVIGHGPGRHGVRIAARRSHTAAASACVQRITRRCAHRESTSSSSLMRRADNRQASLNSSKRNSPSTNTSGVLGDQVAVLLIGLLEQHGLDAPGAVIECSGSRAARVSSPHR